MGAADPAAAFAAFRELVFDDHHLQRRLRMSHDRAAYPVRVVVAGAERGLVFDEAAVQAALREGETAWLLQGVEGS